MRDVFEPMRIDHVEPIAPCLSDDFTYITFISEFVVQRVMEKLMLTLETGVDYRFRVEVDASELEAFNEKKGLGEHPGEPTIKARLYFTKVVDYDETRTE